MTLDTANTLSRLVGPVNIASGTATAFTGSASHIYTLKNIRVVNNTSGAVTFKIGIGGVTDALLVTGAVTLAAGDVYNDDCFIVMSGTQTIQVNGSATGLTLTISGLDQS